MRIDLDSKWLYEQQEENPQSLPKLPRGLREGFISAERKRERREEFWFWSLIVTLVLCGLGMIAWAISKM